MKDWVKVFSHSNPIQVEMMKHLLEEEEIDSVILNKKDSVYGTFGEIELHVPREAVIKALRLINNEDHE